MGCVPYHGGIDQCILKVCVAVEQLLVQKGSILDFLEESDVNDVIRRHVIDGYGFNDGGRHVYCQGRWRHKYVKNEMVRRMRTEL